MRKLVAVALLAASFGASAESMLPFGKEWARGHDLPRPFGFGVDVFTLDQEYEIESLAFTLPGVTLPDALPATPDKAWKTWHFAFHLLPDLPEALIAGREALYLQWFLQRKAASPMVFGDEEMAEYVRLLQQNGALRAGMAAYREVSTSAEQNRQLLQTRGKLAIPLLAVSADQGSIADMAQPLRTFAADVSGIRLAHCGHFIPDEQPQALADALRQFFV